MTMADEQKKHERYEDYLETLDDHQLQAVIEGKATMVVTSASRGFDLVKKILAHEKFEEGAGEQPWIEHLATLTTQEQAAEICGDLDHLGQLVSAMKQRAIRRLEVLHREVCEDCRSEYETKQKAKRALRRGIDAAKAAFSEAIEAEEEPWRQSLSEDDEAEA